MFAIMTARRTLRRPRQPGLPAGHPDQPGRPALGHFRGLRDQRLRKCIELRCARLMTGLAVAVAAAILGQGTAMAAPYCDGAAKASFARAQLFADANCKGGSMIISQSEANGDRPNFAHFRNYDGRTFNVDNTRSSAAVAAGNCIRVFDGASYTGAESNILCAGSTTGYYGFFSFNNRVSSLRICAAARQDHCARSGGVGAPGPGPAPPIPPNGFPPDVTSAPDAARYDDAPSWSGGANCSGGFTRGAKRMQEWLRANWGSATIQGYNCRPNTANTSKTSIHGVGRASDWFRSAGSATHRAQVASFIARMSANGAAMARATGVQYWIWDRQQYSVRGNSVQRNSYSGPNPHTDHVHIEQNIAGSRLETSYWRLAGG